MLMENCKAGNYYLHHNQQIRLYLLVECNMKDQKPEFISDVKLKSKFKV